MERICNELQGKKIDMIKQIENHQRSQQIFSHNKMLYNFLLNEVFFPIVRFIKLIFYIARTLDS